MTFVDIPFPERIALGAESSAMWSTTIVSVTSGHDTAEQNWEDTRHDFDVAPAVRTQSEFAAVRQHFHQVRGKANAFPFKDFLDYTVNASEGTLLDASGVAPAGNGTFNLHKRYGSGGNLYDRRITRPDTPIQVFRTRSAVTTDITGAGATVTYAGGTVAITGHLSGDTYSWSGTFKVPARYDTDKLSATAINKVPGPDGDLIVQCAYTPIVEVRE